MHFSGVRPGSRNNQSLLSKNKHIKSRNTKALLDILCCKDLHSAIVKIKKKGNGLELCG